MEEKLEILTILKELSVSVGNIGAEIKHLNSNYTDIKHKLDIEIKNRLEELASKTSIHYSDIEELKKRIKTNEESIEDLRQNQILLQLSTNRFDKLDNTLNRTKRFFTYITFNNNIVRSLVAALLFALTVLLFSMIIDYVALKLGFDVDTTTKLKESLGR